MLETEKRNANSQHIDKMSTMEMLNTMQIENYNAIKAVEKCIPQIASVIEHVYVGMKKGGHLYYIGCGTSGRLGVLDASECPPTYGVSKDMVVGIIAGGDYALRNAVEKVEDDRECGVSDIKKYHLSKNDSVIGLSVAGGASYVIGALEYAKEVGAFTAVITCNQKTPVSLVSDVSIVAETGAEVITGSTRMKAGTAQKVILNMISTAVMIKMGYVYENLMINITPMNKKLRRRMIDIVCEILNCGSERAEELLNNTGWKISEVVKLSK